MTFIRGILDRIILVAGVVAAGCIPSFIAQYRQRTGRYLLSYAEGVAVELMEANSVIWDYLARIFLQECRRFIQSLNGSV